ncbi:MAG TPA: hypothetical protein VNN12_06790 [Dehalococcoidia bacterium]|nr:hypothetical protein [Dehalococcoidia bacterium]
MPSRVEREIDEILRRLETSLPREPGFRRLRRAAGRAFGASRRALAGAFRRLTAGNAMLLAFALVIGSLVVSRLWDDAGRFMLLAGIALFVLALVASFAGRRSVPERRWRGQVIHYDEPTLADRLRNWWRAKSRRRTRER